MSLKARIEAVIYAAEEPVTLSQLAALFAAELPQPDAAAELDFASPQAAPETTAEAGTSAEADIAAEAETPVEPPSSLAASDTEATADEPSELAGEQPDASAAEADHPEEVVESTPESPAGPPAEVSAEDAAKQIAAAEKAEQRRHRDAIHAIVDELILDYAADGPSARGMEIREVAGGYRMATRPEYHDAVRGFIKSLKPPLKLSLPALETLAVIAYKQPVTAPEIGEIRGVDSGGVLGSLLTRKLIATAGRKQVVGRPILYKTTREFLMRFGLKDVSELPSLEEFEKMAAEISSLDDDAPAAQDDLAFAAAEDADSDDSPIAAEAGVEALHGVEKAAVEEPAVDAPAADARADGAHHEEAIADPREPVEERDVRTQDENLSVPEVDSLAVEVEDSEAEDPKEQP